MIAFPGEPALGDLGAAQPRSPQSMSQRQGSGWWPRSLYPVGKFSQDFLCAPLRRVTPPSLAPTPHLDFAPTLKIKSDGIGDPR
jgi:hypothetical protein